MAEDAAALETERGAAPQGLTGGGVARIAAIDMLRGLVIALMVLDHVRDFFHVDAARFDPTNPLLSTPSLFATRWVTHLCATSFVFLAGVSILLQKENGKGGAELRRFLLTRGAWLILLELTVVSFGFHFAEPMLFVQVIWAIGAGMICISLLVGLRPAAVLGIGVALVAAGPALVSATAGATGAAALLRTLMLAPGALNAAPGFVAYPLLPWFAVMCIGFGVGPLFRLPTERRNVRVLALAAGLLATFLVLRTLNGYGDPVPWQPLPQWWRSAMSYLNVSKYPPSPDFVLATLGASLLAFLVLRALRGPLRSILLTFGRTPLFTYVCHIYIAHGLMLLAAIAAGFPASVATAFLLSDATVRMGWGVPLWAAYGVWLLVLALLYPLSRWFERLRDRRRDWWLRYL
jgi:uncharacterized membrane protein